MATSGTVATTTLDTAVVLEHACRRCGLTSSAQTPETVEIGKQNLYLLLLNLANRGLNLWCVEKTFVPMYVNQLEYPLAPGTVRILNVLHSEPTRAVGTDTTTANSITTQFDTLSSVVRIGVTLTSAISSPITLEYSGDGVTWFPCGTIPVTTDRSAWVDLDPQIIALYFRATSVAPAVFGTFYLATAIRDTPMTQFNRDEYSQQPTKRFTAARTSNYYYDRTVNPSVTVWPVPDNDAGHLTVWRHRFVQDIGSLTQQIEVPQVWMESIIWQLAVRLAYEIPGVDPSRRAEVVQASERFLMDAETGETDGAPVYFVPGIGVYTR